MSNYVVTKYPHGAFCWVDLSSTDVNQAKTFYTGLFGWETEDLPMGDNEFYTFFKKDGYTVAAAAQMRPEMQSQGIPSYWSNYINVDDVDAITAKAQELGANVTAQPFDVFENGRMSVVQDPSGANICFWQAKSHIGASLVNTVGALAWNELQTHDPAKAKAFYSQLLGWEGETDERGYIALKNQGRSNAGISTIAPEWGEMPPHWTPYFRIDKLDEHVEKAKALGAKMTTPIMDVPGLGRFSVVMDPSGADFYLFDGMTEPWVE